MLKKVISSRVLNIAPSTIISIEFTKEKLQKEEIDIINSVIVAMEKGFTK